MGGLRAIRRRTKAMRRKLTEKTKLRFGGFLHGHGSSTGAATSTCATDSGGAGWSTDDSDNEESSLCAANATTKLLRPNGSKRKWDEDLHCAWNEDDQILTLDPTRSSEGENSINSMAIASVAILTSNFGSDGGGDGNGNVGCGGGDVVKTLGADGGDDGGDNAKKPKNNKTMSSDPYRRTQSPRTTQVIHPVICKRDIFIGGGEDLFKQQHQETSLPHNEDIVEPTKKQHQHHHQQQKRRARDPSASYGNMSNKPDAPAEGGGCSFEDVEDLDENSIGMPSNSISGSMLFNSLENSSSYSKNSAAGHQKCSKMMSSKRDAKIKAGAAMLRQSLALTSPTTISNSMPRSAIPHNTIMGSMLFRTLEEEEHRSHPYGNSHHEHHVKQTQLGGGKHPHVNHMRTIQESTDDRIVARKKKTIKFREELEQVEEEPELSGGDDSLFDFQEDRIPQDIIKNTHSTDGSCSHSSVSSITMYTSYSRASYSDPAVVRASSNLFEILRGNNFNQFNNSNASNNNADEYDDDDHLPSHLSEA